MSTSVYIETTIPSAYFETRTDRYAVGIRALTREWWDSRPATYRCFASDLVKLELANPNKLWQMQVLNGNLSLPTPRILTPAAMIAMERGYEPQKSDG